jgi:hypothetical protein
MNINRLKLSVIIVFLVFAVFTVVPVQKNTVAQTDEKKDIFSLIANYKNWEQINKKTTNVGVVDKSLTVVIDTSDAKIGG